MIYRTVAIAFGFLVATGMTAQAQTDSTSGEFPDLVGIWEGEYAAAFARSNSEHPDDTAFIEMQLDVYRQDGNLFWAMNRWRQAGTAEWLVEETTGTFRLDDPTALVIAENAPTPVDWSASGYFDGRVVDDALFLAFIGIGTGTTFAVELDRR
jgi:hypothetical protein